LAGELAVTAANSRHLILRTAWVYSRFGKNFAKTMLRLAKTRDELRVVSDQWGNPTSAADIADCIVEAAARLIDGPAFDQWGVYHLAGNGDTNWSGFARHILDTSRKHGGPFATVTDITTSDYPTKARRPANSRLACGKLESQFGWRAPSWRRSTDLAVELILQGG
jgi:dTDP-4-dehydrorhamnose reductase